MFLRSLVSHKPAPAQGGFGLIELMVSITIMVIVSGIILANQSSFNGAVLLRSQAYEVALTLREIQLNAVSSVSDGSGDFSSNYGIYFNTANAFNQRFIVFRDATTDGYDGGEEFGVQGFLDTRFEVDTITVGGTGESELSVVFKRPNFDAIFYDGGGSVIDESEAEIVIRRVGTTGTGIDSIRTVVVTQSGQISVK